MSLEVVKTLKENCSMYLEDLYTDCSKFQEQEGKKQERAVRKFETNGPADTKVRKEGWGRDATGSGTDIPLQPMVQTMDLGILWGHKLGQSVPEGLYPMERASAGAVLELQFVEKTPGGEVHGGLSPMSEMPHQSRERV
ncbi:hypothetical protein WISP_105207 [Willisornis vidua]|uniref:Uncharacterized protein n=1 Tax=Willisornis vidua TaxID=1566151 RepID=A0ABQ9D2J3_9PASS|nr:hypothetical protein WISP_105207 [Willisornis vidua]